VPDSIETELRRELAAAGLNACGVLGRTAWDELVPAAFRADRLAPRAATALVAGAGGRDLFAAFRRSPEAQRTRDPLDAYTERVVGAAAGTLRSRGFQAACVFAHESREGQVVDFVALGHAVGLGWPSRLGLLLHPTYGPWLSLRAVVLSDAPLARSGSLAGPGPCPACEAPCARACPGRALHTGSFDAARCGATRRAEPGCRSRCEARRACVVGPEHAYAAAAEAHHMAASWPAMVESP
jgi:hypothetical protein